MGYRCPNDLRSGLSAKKLVPASLFDSANILSDVFAPVTLLLSFLSGDACRADQVLLAFTERTVVIVQESSVLGIIAVIVLPPKSMYRALYWQPYRFRRSSMRVCCCLYLRCSARTGYPEGYHRILNIFREQRHLPAVAGSVASRRERAPIQASCPQATFARAKHTPSRESCSARFLPHPIHRIVIPDGSLLR